MPRASEPKVRKMALASQPAGTGKCCSQGQRQKDAGNEACQSGVLHFGHAIAANLWHETAIIVSAAVIVAIAWDASNHAGVRVFLLLWWMYRSAGLNVLLGVGNVSEEFVPAHMEVLKSFLTQKPMNFLLPVPATVATITAVVLFTWAAQATGAERLFAKSLLPQNGIKEEPPAANRQMIAVRQRIILTQ